MGVGPHRVKIRALPSYLKREWPKYIEQCNQRSGNYKQKELTEKSPQKFGDRFFDKFFIPKK
jgi:hypothetical protein